MCSCNKASLSPMLSELSRKLNRTTQKLRRSYSLKYLAWRKTTSTSTAERLLCGQKPLATAPNRLMLRLMQYDVEIEYKRGPELCHAILFPEHTHLWNRKGRSRGRKNPLCVHSVNFLSVGEPQIREIRGETAKDPVLLFLEAVILNG